MSKQMRQLVETVKYDDMLRMLDEAYEQEQLEKEIRAYESTREHRIGIKEAARYITIEYGYLAS